MPPLPLLAPPPPIPPPPISQVASRAPPPTRASSSDRRPGPAARRRQLPLRRRHGVEDARRLAGGRAGPRRLDLERGLEIVDHLADVLVALRRVLGGRALDDQRHRGRDLGPAALDVGEILVDVFHRHPDLAVGVERDLADQHLVEDDAEAVDVGARVGGVAHRLLGGDVVGGAEDAAGGGHPVLFELAGDAEVGQFRPPLVVDEDVLGLDVAVDHVAGVGDAEAAGDLDRVGDRLLDVEGADPRDPLLQRLAFDVLEDDVGVAVVLAGVDHRDDVGVGDLRDRPRLLPEALDLVGLLRHLAVHDLDRDRAVEGLVFGQVDGGHAAAAQLRLQPVAAREHGADHRAGRSGLHLTGQASQAEAQIGLFRERGDDARPARRPGRSARRPGSAPGAGPGPPPRRRPGRRSRSRSPC